MENALRLLLRPDEQHSLHHSGPVLVPADGLRQFLHAQASLRQVLLEEGLLALETSLLRHHHHQARVGGTEAAEGGGQRGEEVLVVDAIGTENQIRLDEESSGVTRGRRNETRLVPGVPPG